MRERRFTLHDHCLKQLGIEARKGSITPGKDADFLMFDNDLLTAEQEGFGYNKLKDADFLVFDDDLLTAEHEGFSHNKPSEVFICGEKVN